MPKPKLSVEQFNTIKRDAWFNFVDMKTAKKYHGRNMEAWKSATAEYLTKDRPLRILAVHGSGRSSDLSCAYEASNSKLFLQNSLSKVRDDANIEIEEISLRDYYIEPCNNCVATTSALCNAPCTCFPIDDMQLLYPKVLRADIIFCSTGVNQSTMSSRLKLFTDRLISADGGIWIDIEQFGPKNGEYKDRMQAIAAEGRIAYDQRLHGRIGAYFISSKDNDNPHEVVNHLPVEKFEDVKYGELTAYVLKDNAESYGLYHAPNYYAVAASDPDVDYMWDKEHLMQNTKALEWGRSVVADAIAVALDFKQNPPKFKTDRYNRT